MPELSRPAIHVTKALLIGCLATIPLVAQNAQITGLVTDPTGAVIQKARIEIRNQATSASRSTTTNADGLYVAAFLNPGVYTISADAKGFKRFEQTDIRLDAAQQGTVNLKLEVGSASESVTVSGSVPLVNSTDASVSTVVDRQFVENMPLNGRSFQSLIALSPGVVITPSADTGDQGQFSVAGQRSGSNYFTIDGVSANFAAPTAGYGGQTNNGGLVAWSALGSTNSLVSVDALQEFRLVTSTYAPEFGRQSGGQVVLVTRSGTNQFHGTAFDYLRNDVLDANDWFAASTGQPKPRERQNDFGGVLGGPIIKDKTFFFFSYEGLRAAQPKVSIVDVPSLEARARATEKVKPLLDAFPLPNGPSTGIYLNQLSATYSNPTALDATSIRVDHAINSKTTIFGRFNYSPSSISLRLCGGGGAPTTVSLICDKNVNVYTTTVGLTAIISPTITNDLRFNYSRSHGGVTYRLDDFGGAVVPPESALFPSFITPDTGFTGVLIYTGRNVGYWHNGTGTNRLNRQINFTDSVNVVKGTHSMKFGFDFRRLTPEGEIYQQYAIYGWSFGGNPMPAFVSGATPDYLRIGGQGPNPPRLLFHNFSSFAQDTWKTSRRLTLTYGVRWDYNPPPTEATGNTYAISEVTNLATATLLPKGSPFWHPSAANFAPRVGLSYQLNQNTERPTVLRVGTGLFYDLGTSTAGFLDDGFGWFPYSLTYTPCNRGVGPDCSNSVPYTGPKPPFVFTQPYPQMRVFDPHLKLPYSLQWNVALEQTLSSSQTFKMTYLGSAGRRLLKDNLISNPNPIFSGLFLTTNYGYSNYEALQLQFQRRLSNGLQALVSYSWSHSLDTNSSDVTGGGSSGIPVSLVNVRQDYGDSDFDIRQSFSAAVTYNIPAAKLDNPFVRALLRDWSIDGITSARTGTAFNVVYSPAVPGAFSGPTGTFSLRPDQVPGQPVYINDVNAPGGKRLNPGAFVVPSVLGQGSENRNSIRGFPLIQIDLALRRQFQLSERINLQFRAEGFNVINHANFANPLSGIGTCTVGVSCAPVYGWGTSQALLNQSMSGSGIYGTGFGSLYQIGGPRSLQLSMKLQF